MTATETISTLGTAPHLITPLPGPKAKAAIERDHRVTSPSYTRDFPLVVHRGSGCVVEDVAQQRRSRQVSPGGHQGYGHDLTQQLTAESAQSTFRFTGCKARRH